MTPRLTDEQVASLSTTLPGWSLVGSGAEGGAISKRFEFPTYKAGLEFAVAVGTLADELDHHPDILIGYRKVDITTSTHDADGLSEKDLDLARRIDAL